MMLMIGGGVKEHGRNCFYIQGNRINIMLDAGISGNALQPYPKLSKEQIRSCDYLFLSHSHKDHSGAINYLLQQGFRGTLLTSGPTISQLSSCSCHHQLIEELAPEDTWVSLTESLAFCWGRSGHCTGSVWFQLQLDGKVLLYSGDYREENAPYPCCSIRAKHADLAILDCAYGYEELTKQHYLDELIATMKQLMAQGKKLLLPVPLHGRGLSLYMLCRQVFAKKQIYLCEELAAQTASMDSFWTMATPWSNDTKKETADILLLADAQLQQPVHQCFHEQWIQEGNVTMFTGECDPSSYAYAQLKASAAVFQRYPVHMNIADVQQLMKQNQFQRVIPFHSSQCTCLIEQEQQELISSCIEIAS